MQAAGSISCSASPVPAGQGRIKATTMMAPQMVRALAAGQPHDLNDAAVAEACTMWALAVCLFFLLNGRWPFLPEKIRQWPATPAAEWSDDALLALMATGTAPQARYPGPLAQPRSMNG